MPGTCSKPREAGAEPFLLAIWAIFTPAQQQRGECGIFRKCFAKVVQFRAAAHSLTCADASPLPWLSREAPMCTSPPKLTSAGGKVLEIIFSEIKWKTTQKSLAWLWRADTASGSGGHSSLPWWNSLKIFLLRRYEGQAIKMAPNACQSGSENDVFNLCFKALPFLMHFYKAVCATLHLQNTAKASVVSITDEVL